MWISEWTRYLGVWLTLYWLTDWVAEWLTNWLTKWLIDKVTDWLSGWLTEWLSGWLTHSPTNPLTHHSSTLPLTTHPLTHLTHHPPTRSHAWSLTHHSPTPHLPTHLLIHPSTYPLTYHSSTHPPNHSLTHPLTQHSSTHSLTHPLTHPLTHTLTHPFTHFMDKSPSADSIIVPSVELKHLPLGSQEIITLPVAPALSQVNLIYTCPVSFKTHFDMIVSFLIRSYKLSLSFTFCHQNPVWICFLLHMCKMPCPSHHAWYYHPNNYEKYNQPVHMQMCVFMVLWMA